MNIVIFEEETDKLYPISLTRPAWEIRSGCFTQRERIEIFLQKNGYEGSNIYYFTRDYLVPLFKEKYSDLRMNDYSFLDSDDDVLFINGGIFPDERIMSLKKNTLLLHNNVPILARVESSKLQKSKSNITELLMKAKDVLKEENDSFERIEYIWDLIKDNGKKISEDFDWINRAKKSNVDDNVAIIGNGSNLYIEEDVRIDPFVCIDLSDGPVVIRKGSVINSFSRIEGPCYIGRDCIILGAKVREGCSFGDCCRIGGEVEESIFHGYSNKYHDGFIGHSYIGEWINLGALTTNSDLKNDYSEVKVYIPGRRYDTGSIKAGCFIGDFVKTSIGTLITTGASIGVGSMAVHSGTFTPYHIPSFTWYIENRIIDTAIFGDFLESCEKMTSRRGINFSDNYKKLLTTLYDMTDEIRKKEMLKWKRRQK